MARRGLTTQAWRGAARPGKGWRVIAGEAWNDVALHGLVRRDIAGTAWPGEA